MREILIEKMYIDDLEKNNEYLFSKDGKLHIKGLTIFSANNFRYISTNVDSIFFVQLFNVLNSEFVLNQNCNNDLLRLVYLSVLKKHALAFVIDYDENTYNFFNSEFVAEIIFDCFKQIIDELSANLYFEDVDDMKNINIDISDILNAGAEMIIKRLY